MIPAALRRLIDPALLRAARRPGSLHANDASAIAGCNWGASARELPPGLELQWLGAAGYRIAYRGYAIAIDPYLSRPSLFGSLRPPALPVGERVSRFLAPVDAVLVGHTHIDHALDVPEIARRDRARILGSRSLAHLMHLHGLGAQAELVEPLQRYELGPFRVRFVPSAHSKMLAGLAVFAGGELSCAELEALDLFRYRCGEVYGLHLEVAGVSLYHQGSAAFDESVELPRDVDVFICCIAGRRFSRDYVARILSRLSPGVVLASHYDNFFRPLDRPMGFSPNVNAGGFLDEVGAVSAELQVRTLDLLQCVRGP